MKNYAQASWRHGIAVVSLLAAASAGAQPVLVYDNSANPLNSYFASQTEFGDQITVANPGWIADTFRFEYFADGLSGTETAVVRFYLNDGDLLSGTDIRAPGSILYESPAFQLHNGNIPVTITDLASLSIELPESFTWTVSVDGIDGSGIFGLNLYDPPTVGSSLDDIWLFGDSGWELFQLPGLPDGAAANFGATLTAVPEPGPVALLALGALALFMRRRKAVG